MYKKFFFCLSSLRNKQLSVAAEANNWYQIELKMPKPISAQNGKTLEGIEVLTANYPISVADGEIKLLQELKSIASCAITLHMVQFFDVLFS